MTLLYQPVLYNVRVQVFYCATSSIAKNESGNKLFIATATQINPL